MCLDMSGRVRTSPLLSLQASPSIPRTPRHLLEISLQGGLGGPRGLPTARPSRGIGTPGELRWWSEPARPTVKPTGVTWVTAGPLVHPESESTGYVLKRTREGSIGNWILHVSPMSWKPSEPEHVSLIGPRGEVRLPDRSESTVAKTVNRSERPWGSVPLLLCFFFHTHDGRIC